MSNKAYGSITVTDLLDTATYIYYSATGSSSVAGNWHKEVQSGDLYIGIYNGPPLDGGQPTNPTSAILNQLVISKYVGDIGTSIINVTPLYYAKANNTAPNKPTTAVTKTTTVGGEWTKGIPELTSTYPYMFTCEQVQYDSTSVGTNGYTWTDPVLNNMITKFVENYNSFVAGDTQWKSVYGEKITTIESDYTTSSDVQSAITQSANGIRSEVSSTYTTKSDAIKSDTLHYLATSASSGVTKNTSGWTTTIQTVTAEKKYLWIYHTYTKADNTTTDTTPVIYGVYGETGPQGETGPAGTSVTVSKTEYQSGTSNTTAPTGTWSTTIPSVAEGNYLWTRVTYSDSSIAYSVAKQGKSGTNGTSPTVTSTKVQYQKSTSGTTVPTGTWSDSAIAPTTTEYVWIKTTITYSDGKTAVSYSVGGKTGTNGADGKMLYATCPTAEATVAKVATITPATTLPTPLPTGLTVAIKFTYANSAVNPTLNVNSTGAKAIYAGEVRLAGNYNWHAGDTCVFVYDGSNWQLTSQNVDVGGRNLAPMVSAEEGYLTASAAIGALDPTLGGMSATNREHTSSYIPVIAGDNYIIQYYATIPNGYYFWCAYRIYDSEKKCLQARWSQQGAAVSADTAWNKELSIVMPTNAAFIRISMRFYNDGKWKFEKGNIATDWTPAPEDMASQEDLTNTASGLSSDIADVSAIVTSHSSSIEELSDSIESVVEYTETLQGDNGIIKQMQSNIKQNADNVTIALGYQDTIDSIQTTFTFAQDGLEINKSNSNIYSKQGANYYKFIDKEKTTDVFEINEKGTTGLQSNVIGQIGIGAGSVAEYTEQWAIRKGAYVSGVGYNLDFVWVGGN